MLYWKIGMGREVWHWNRGSVKGRVLVLVLLYDEWDSIL